MDVFQQIFDFEEYACLRDISSPRVILDLGANVGFSSAYFLSCFPTARVLAVEPDPVNFESCRKNLAPYGGRVQVVLGAVWSHNSRLKLSQGAFRDGRGWATQVVAIEDPDAGTVESFDIPTLLDLAGAEYVDLLKVDIERSEIEVFASGTTSWMPRVHNICIELHGADCKEVFMKALEGFEYDLSTYGELTVCRNLRRTETLP